MIFVEFSSALILDSHVTIAIHSIPPLFSFLLICVFLIFLIYVVCLIIFSFPSLFNFRIASEIARNEQEYATKKAENILEEYSARKDQQLENYQIRVQELELILKQENHDKNVEISLRNNLLKIIESIETDLFFPGATPFDKKNIVRWLEKLFLVPDENNCFHNTSNKGKKSTLNILIGNSNSDDNNNNDNFEGNSKDNKVKANYECYMIKNSDANNFDSMEQRHQMSVMHFYDKNQNQYNDKNQNLNDNKNQNQNNVLKSHITKLYIVSRGETGHLSGGGDIRGTYVTSFK